MFTCQTLDLFENEDIWRSLNRFEPGERRGVDKF